MKKTTNNETNDRAEFFRGLLTQFSPCVMSAYDAYLSEEQKQAILIPPPETRAFLRLMRGMREGTVLR